jgi:hypothetical protein
MINRAGSKHLFPDKERRLTVRQFFPRLRQGKANAPNSFHLGFFSSASLGGLYLRHLPTSFGVDESCV